MYNDSQTIAMLRDLVGHATAGMDKASQIQQEQQDNQADVEEMIPDVVATLVANNHSAPGEGTKVAQMLRHHTTTLHLLQKVAEASMNYTNNTVGTVYKKSPGTIERTSIIAERNYDDAYDALFGLTNY